MTHPTVVASRSVWVIELLRRFAPVVRERMPWAPYDEVAAVIVSAADDSLESGRDVESCVDAAVCARVGVESK